MRIPQVLSTLGFFFGDPAVPEKLKDYSEHHAMYAPPPFANSVLLRLMSPVHPYPKDLPVNLLRFFTHRTYHFPDGAHHADRAART